MQANPRRRHWPADRIPLQRTVMGLTLAVYPHWRTIPELAVVPQDVPNASHRRAVAES
jgi:hypothetical protein